MLRVCFESQALVLTKSKKRARVSNTRAVEGAESEGLERGRSEGSDTLNRA
jgi:hypothetical protein